MLSVALTGNIASGKSTVAEAWAAAGVPVVSADELARTVVAPGSPGLAEVREAFGDDVIALDGTLDRARMRTVVFGDESARKRLEEITHPRIWALREEWLEECRADGERLVVSEIPLLFETGHAGDFDRVVLVDAPAPIRLGRIVETRGLSEEAARAVMATQMDPDLKRSRSDIVIDNDGDLDALLASADRSLVDLRAQAGVEPLRMDLHMHTAGSWDCLSDPQAVLRTARAQGIGRIAITDHNRLHVALRMAEAHPDAVIPGEEVKTAEGIDVIGLYLHTEIPKGTPAHETIDQIRDQGGIPYLPHPFAGGKGGGGRMAVELGRRCDVIEVFNARLHDATMNDRADELARAEGKLRSGGSDAHSLGELGRVFVDVPPHPNRPDALRAALRHAVVHGTESPHWVHLHSTWAKIRKKLPGAPRG